MCLLKATLLCVFLIGLGSPYVTENNDIHLPSEGDLLRSQDVRDSREVRARGRIIKWLDYDHDRDGVPDERAIYVVCDGVFAIAPFLLHSLRHGTLAIDTDEDGEAELTLDIGPPLDVIAGGEMRNRILHRAPGLPTDLENLAADILRNRDFDPSAFLEFLTASPKCRPT
jgi:hypothetical protein